MSIIKTHSNKKIHILFEFKDGPWGGGNQFLKALRNEFKKNNIYTDNPANADFILFNSHHNPDKVLKLKFKYPQKIFVHRIDGPIFFIRNKNLVIDKLIFKLSTIIADLSIFQSNWSLQQSIRLGFHENNNRTVIYNAPDKVIFNTKNKTRFKEFGKVKLIATSWSGHPNKGFDVYKHLDNHLDFKQYEFVFIGNSPIKFKNIHHIQPLPSKELAKELKKSDIFITASKNDPCSNSLIEALSCGLPAVVFNDGGHPELIQKGGEVFSFTKEIIDKIDQIVNNYNYYQNNIPKYDMNRIALQYWESFNKLKTTSQKIKILSFFYLLLQIKLTKLISFFK